MALSTTNESRPALRQQPTPGVATQGGATVETREAMPPGSTAGVGTVPLAGIGMLPGTEGGMTGIAPLGQLRPVLHDDIDPILLARLYPYEDDVRAAALAAGEERAAMSEDVVASQDEPIPVEGETREERDERGRKAREAREGRGYGARAARRGHNEPPLVASGTPPAGTPPPIHRPTPPPQQPTSPTRQPDDEHKPEPRRPAHDDKKDDENKRDEKRDDKK